MNAFEIVSKFIDRINAHDVDGMCALMEENHVFIDGLGRSVMGRQAMRKAWQAYFAGSCANVVGKMLIAF